MSVKKPSKKAKEQRKTLTAIQKKYIDENAKKVKMHLFQKIIF